MVKNCSKSLYAGAYCTSPGIEVTQVSTRVEGISKNCAKHSLYDATHACGSLSTAGNTAEGAEFTKAAARAEGLLFSEALESNGKSASDSKRVRYGGMREP